VGKTELARALAEYLFGSADRMVRIDMSEFQDPGAMERLTGNPLLNAGGLITEPVREQPFCLVLLDEIEKAYRGVHDLLLQVFDGGRLTDGRGRTTSFRRTVIAMTSNVGSDTPRGGAVGFVEAKERDRLDALAAVENSFRRELVNRIDHIVAFRPLGVDAMEGIARRELQRALSRSGLVRRSVSVDLDPSVLSLILRQGFSPRYGARPLKRAIEQHVLVPIARKLVGVTGRGEEPTVLQVDGRGGATVHVRLVEEPPKPKVKVNVTDPFGDGRSEKFDLPQIRERVRLLIASLRELRRLCEQRDYSGEIAALTLEMGRHGAWANPNDARSRTARLHMLEQLLSSLRAAERRAADLEEQSQSSEIDRKRDTLKRLGERILVEEEHYRLLRFEVGTTHEDDRYDGFLEISLVDGQGPHPGPVALLARMYEAYAKRHSLRCTHLFEEVDDNGLPSSAELYIEGVPAYGLLRNESGIHRFSWAHTGASTYSNVRVHLLPDRPHAAPPLRPSDVLREELPARGPRVLVGSARTSLRLTHAPSLTTVRVMVSDDTSAREALALDLLAARVAAASTAMSPPLEVVRRYRMGTQQEVRDQNTGLRTGRLEHVLAGHLDPFVLPQLEHTLTAELRGGRP
jgi:protein subunit release factor A